LAFKYFDFERHLMKVILNVPDEGYSRNVPDEGYFERHLMKVIPETRCAHSFWYLRFY